MALQVQDLMARLSPAAPLNFNDTGDQNKSLERQRLELMRQEFEETKRQHQQQMELNRLEEGGRMAREQMVQQRLTAEKQAEQAAAIKAKQNEALGKFTELNGKGQIAEARAMVPMLTQMGVPVSLEGEEGGLPRYRFGPDPEEQARGQGAIGYPTDEAGTLDDGPGIASSSGMTPEQLARVTGGGSNDRAATDQALAAAQTPLTAEPDIGPPEAGAVPDNNPIKPEFQQPPQSLDPLAGIRPATLAPVKPAEPDYTGGVPKNVLDMGAIQQQTLARLNPAMDAITRSYPSEYRDSVAETAKAVGGMGLDGEKSLETFDKLRSSPDSIIRAQIQADAQRGEQGDKAMAQASKESQRRYMSGYNSMGKDAATKYGVDTIIEHRSSIARSREVLTNKSTQDDYLAGAGISRLMGERGATTEPDVQRALGSASVSFFDKLRQGLYKEAIGGLSPPQRDALIGVLDNAEKQDQKRVDEFMANVDALVGDPETDKDVARGLRDYVKVVIPADMRARKKDGAKVATVASAPAAASADTGAGAPAQETPADADFGDELALQAADAGLDERAVGGVINVESQGNPAAHNPSGATGLIQFMPSIAKAMGTTTEAIGKMTAAQQVPLVIKYLKDRGIDQNSTQGDMYVAVAAGGDFVGKPDETVVYKKGSPGWEQNKPWRPADGGDITVGSIKRFGGGKPEEPPANAGATPLSAKLKAMRERMGL